MFNDLSSPLALLQTRRSGKPRDLVTPGPDEAQMRQILEIAMRTPDHGKLAPWRFILYRGAGERPALLLGAAEDSRVGRVFINNYRRQNTLAVNLETANIQLSGFAREPVFRDHRPD